MADAFLSSLVEAIVTNLTSSAVQQFGNAWDLETDVENLRSTLSTIQAVLMDAEAKQWKSEAVGNWLRKLNDSAYDADNVVDEFATEALKRKLDSQGGVTHRVSSFFSRRNPLTFRFTMGRKIKDVQERLDKIAGEKIKFHLREGLMETEYREIEGRQTSSLLNESEIVGRNDEKEKIIGMLLQDLSYTDGVSVCAIWGMGGLGKTTLAKLVYNDRRVEASFDLRIWVCVSDDFNIGRLTREILESIEGGGCNITNLDPLQRRLQEKLAGRRFLLVLDDVWNENPEKWDRLKDVLRCGAKGSKLLVTTRSKEVAQIMATLPVQGMAGLSEDDSWSLFKRRAFGNGRKEDNHDLDQIGKAIVKKCGGLPLAINALGSLMQSKSSVSEWLSVKDSEIWDLDGSAILPALRLSYDNLPLHWRKCFAYCCIFPKDTKMEKDMLIGLWMANGFIPSRGETTSHDMGHQIFNDLVWRSFLQDVEEDFKGETVCRMHDLMHDLAQFIMRYECYIGDPLKDLKIPEKIRHFFLNIDSLRSFRGNEVVLEAPSLWSFILVGRIDSSLEEICRIISKQKYLRVLHLRACDDAKKLSIAIFRLKHLRYLDMSNSDMESMPESVCDLHNLETLKLKFCWRLCTLPERMKQMKNLIYLDIRGCRSLTSMPPNLGQLTSLRRLGIFIVGQDEGYRVGELKELNLGGELTIKQLDNVRNSADAESANLKRKPDLVSLDLHWSYHKKEILPKNAEDVLECLQPYSNLKKLSIDFYPGSKFPNWMSGSLLQNLVELSLRNCGRCEQLPPLGKLLSLKKLDICKCNNLTALLVQGSEGMTSLKSLSISFCRNLRFLTEELLHLTALQSLEINGCPKIQSFPEGTPRLDALQTLLIYGCRGLSTLPSWLGSLQSLSSLTIIACPNLRSMPAGLRGQKRLRELDISNCPDLERRCKKARGEDWPNIAHIPFIEINNVYEQYSED